MAAFLSAQLDFIFFFYGLAFILLGAVCFAIARGGQEQSWAMLGLFGFVHGASEWLDLIALIIGDNLAFTVARTAVMGASFLFLIEFARQEAVGLGWRMPGRWLYVPLISFVALAGVAGGLTTANVSARYALGLVGATATSWILLRNAKEFSGTEKLWAVAAAIGFGLYAVAAGVITPATPFWPASVFNYEWFFRSTGIPIQLVRGLLACWIACSVWAIWGQKRIQTVSSARYASYVRTQFIWTLAAMGAILVSGWVLTDYLGAIYKRDVEAQSRGDIDLLASRLNGETAITEVMVKLLAGAPAVQALMGDGRLQGGERMLELAVEASGSERGSILDRSGTVVAASGSRESVFSGAGSFGNSPDFRKSMNGDAGYHLAFDAETGDSNYLASYPIRGDSGDVAGVAVLVKSLHSFGADLGQYSRTFFMIDPHGVIVLTNRPEMMLRTMWPLSTETQLEVARQLGELKNQPMTAREVLNAEWTLVDGAHDFVRRRYIDHTQWSLVILKPSQEIFPSRLLGIAITLLMTIMILVYVLGRERAIHDHIQMEKRLELQELASDMQFQATTDPLTGLSNRLRFNEAMALEMSRSRRYGTPLSLVLYDIDHFKTVNDTHGHLTGDKVLVQISQFVAGQIRIADLLARWGGEEFAILLPEANIEMAGQFADKLRESIRQSHFDEAGTLTCSFGIAEFEPTDTAKTLISRADKALYQAKINGRDRVELSLQRAEVDARAESAA
jgi:diguanylate cyclase (GGDEF)-like protein